VKMSFEPSGGAAARSSLRLRLSSGTTCIRIRQRFCLPEVPERAPPLWGRLRQAGKGHVLQSCGDTMTEPEVEFLCLDCYRSTSGDHAGYRDWYEYDLLPDGISAVKSGRLPSADSEDCALGRTLRDFRLLVRHSISVAKLYRPPPVCRQTDCRHHRVVTRVDSGGSCRCANYSRRRGSEPAKARYVGMLPDAVLVCMPETDEAAAKVVVDHIQRAISAAVASRVKT